MTPTKNRVPSAGASGRTGTFRVRPDLARARWQTQRERTGPGSLLPAEFSVPGLGRSAGTAVRTGACGTQVQRRNRDCTRANGRTKDSASRRLYKVDRHLRAGSVYAIRRNTAAMTASILSACVKRRGVAGERRIWLCTGQISAQRGPRMNLGEGRRKYGYARTVLLPEVPTVARALQQRAAAGIRARLVRDHCVVARARLRSRRLGRAGAPRVRAGSVWRLPMGSNHLRPALPKAFCIPGGRLWENPSGGADRIC